MKLENCSRKFINKKFHKFLREFEVYESYYLNRKYTIAYSNTDLNEEGPFNYIMSAFDWREEADEEGSFWADINNEWKRRLVNEEIKENRLINLI